MRDDEAWQLCEIINIVIYERYICDYENGGIAR